MAWTDERLDDLARRTDAGFDHVSGEIRDMRQEIAQFRSETYGEMGAVRAEMGSLCTTTAFHTETGSLRAEIDLLRTEMHEGFRELRGMLVRVGGGIIVGFAGVIATIGVRGI